MGFRQSICGAKIVNPTSRLWVDAVEKGFSSNGFFQRHWCRGPKMM